MVLLYRSSNNFTKFDTFINACKGKRPTLCVVKTEKGRIFGMYTDIAWNNVNKNTREQFKKQNGNSLIFKFDDDDLRVYPVKKGEDEVFHSTRYIFSMSGGPCV